MSVDFNGLSDLQVETTGGTFGRLVLGAMLLIFAAASMITTFAFFATYAPGLGDVLHPAYGWAIAGAMGVLLFDLAGLGWTVLRARNSDTTRQFVIATAAAVVTIILALLTSALQVLLSTSFDVGLYETVRSAAIDPATGAAMVDAAGAAIFTETAVLSQFGQTMQLAGVVVMTLGFVLNFAAIAAYVNVGRDVSAAVQTTQLKAYVTAGRFAADQARAQLVVNQTLQSIMKQLPQIAAAAGQQNSGDYFNHSFGGATVIDQQPEPEQPETAVSPTPAMAQTPQSGQKRPSIGFGGGDTVNLVDLAEQQAAADRMTYKPAARSVGGSQRTLAHDGQRWLETWVGGDGTPYATPATLPSDVGRAWADARANNLLPSGMSFERFTELHKTAVNFTQRGK
jgi:hypothetical protein